MRALVGLAVVPEDLALLGRLVDGTEAVEGLSIDQDMRWSIATKFVGYDMPDAEQRINAEQARDESDRGQRALRRAETSRPDAATKAAAWERIHGEGYGSLHLTASAMSGFHWSRQRTLGAPYVEPFFARLPEIFATREKEFATAYFGNMFPHYLIEQATLDRTERLLAEAGSENPLLSRMLQEVNDDLTRALKVRAFTAS